MLITVLIAIAFGTCVVFANRTRNYNKEMTFSGLAILLAIMLFFFGIICLATCFNESKEDMDQQYAVLTEKIEADYWYGNPILTTDLVNDIQEYNKLVKSMKNTYSNPWTSWFGRAWMMELQSVPIPGGGK